MTPKKVTIFENVKLKGSVILRATRNGVFAKVYAQYQPTEGVRRGWRTVPVAVVEFDYHVKDILPLAGVEDVVNTVMDLIHLRNPDMKVFRKDFWGVGKQRIDQPKEKEHEETKTATSNA